MEEENNGGMLDESLISNAVPLVVFSARKIIIFTIVAFLITMTMSFTICMTNTNCKNNIPTVYTLLESPLSAPYMYSALGCALFIFVVTCVLLYAKTQMWIIFLSGWIVGGSIGVILFVFPFTGWNGNWAILIFNAAFLLWMAVASFITRERRYKLKLFLVVLFALATTVHMVLKFVDIHVPNINVGVLVVEIIGAISIVVFFTITIGDIWDEKFARV